MSYNIQTGITSEHYRHYLTHSWKHVLPHAQRWQNLDLIAEGLSGFDIVGLQEVDSGSLRTGFINQTEYLAQRAGFPYWHFQTNRRLGKLAQHSNGLLARVAPHALREYKLPGMPGRGALVARFGSAKEPLLVVIVHLSLGKRSRLRQMAYLAELVADFRHAMVLGDLNCDASSEEMRLLLRRTRLTIPPEELHTFPSWRPRKRIDHILLSSEMAVERAYVPPWLYSDHLPLAMDIVVPGTVGLL